MKTIRMIVLFVLAFSSLSCRKASPQFDPPREGLLLARAGHYEKIDWILMRKPSYDELGAMGTSVEEIRALFHLARLAEISRALSLWREGTASKGAAVYIVKMMDKYEIVPVEVGLSLKERHQLYKEILAYDKALGYEVLVLTTAKNSLRLSDVETGNGIVLK